MKFIENNNTERHSSSLQINTIYYILYWTQLSYRTRASATAIDDGNNNNKKKKKNSNNKLNNDDNNSIVNSII